MKELANKRKLQRPNQSDDAGKEEAKIWGWTIDRFFDAPNVTNPALRAELERCMPKRYHEIAFKTAEGRETRGNHPEPEVVPPSRTPMAVVHDDDEETVSEGRGT